MSDKIFIVDFEDSFTFNIANVLFQFEPNIKVLVHTDFFLEFDTYIKGPNRIAVILGPGPGHPDQYEMYSKKIKLLMNQTHIYVMGICLGHQIMARVCGYEVKKSTVQMHGQSVEIFFNGVSTRVQRYNSLSVFHGNDEISICEYKNAISYQFHPESVGTLQNDLFFRDLLNFLKS